MKKKVISAVLTAAIISCSTLTGFAAETEHTESSSGRNFTVIEETTIPSNTARFFAKGENIDPTSGLEFFDPVEFDRDGFHAEPAAICYFDFKSEYKDVNLPNLNGYRYMQRLNSSLSGNTKNKANFNTTGGEYECIRVKLLEYSDYFNSDGTHTDDINGISHNFNFAVQDTAEGYHTSSLIFMSGGAITGVAPTSDGYADIYVSTKLGQETQVMTNLDGYGGGVVDSSFNSFMIGNVDNDEYISISDAVDIQKYSLNISAGFDELSKRNSDTNYDGIITLADAIEVLKYAVGVIK